MSCILYGEKRLFEELFEMKGGYVLDFSNRDFQEFIFETLGIDVYKKYEGEKLSKAKILRRLYEDLSDQQLALLLKALLKYMDEFGGCKDSKKFDKARSVVDRLSGKIVNLNKSSVSDRYKNIFDYRHFLDELINISAKNVSKQNKGYDFEKYLMNIFDAAGLKPRNSYRIEGEQIDGSIYFYGNIYLVEAKWTDCPVNRNDLVVFADKVSRKSNFARGIFISHSGFVENAVNTFANGKNSPIVLMDVREIAWLLENEIDIKDALAIKIRKLAEEGKCYYNVVGSM